MSADDDVFQIRSITPDSELHKERVRAANRLIRAFKTFWPEFHDIYGISVEGAKICLVFDEKEVDAFIEHITKVPVEKLVATRQQLKRIESDLEERHEQSGTGDQDRKRRG